MSTTWPPTILRQGRRQGPRRRGVRPAKALMQIALIVDDNGTGLFRAPLYRFVQRLQGKAEFSS